MESAMIFYCFHTYSDTANATNNNVDTDANTTMNTDDRADSDTDTIAVNDTDTDTYNNTNPDTDTVTFIHPLKNVGSCSNFAPSLSESIQVSWQFSS